MSFSFSVRRASKAEAIAAVAAELDKVVADQPIHAKDRAPALAAATAFVDLLADDESKNLQVAVHGSIELRGPEATLTSASVGVSAYLIDKDLPKTGADLPRMPDPKPPVLKPEPPATPPQPMP